MPKKIPTKISKAKFPLRPWLRKKGMLQGVRKCSYSEAIYHRHLFVDVATAVHAFYKSAGFIGLRRTEATEKIVKGLIELHKFYETSKVKSVCYCFDGPETPKEKKYVSGFVVTDMDRKRERLREIEKKIEETEMVRIASVVEGKEFDALVDTTTDTTTLAEKIEATDGGPVPIDVFKAAKQIIPHLKSWDFKEHRQLKDFVDKNTIYSDDGFSEISFRSVIFEAGKRLKEYVASSVVRSVAATSSSSSSSSSSSLPVSTTPGIPSRFVWTEQGEAEWLACVLANQKENSLVISTDVDTIAAGAPRVFFPNKLSGEVWERSKLLKKLGMTQKQLADFATIKGLDVSLSPYNYRVSHALRDLKIHGSLENVLQNRASEFIFPKGASIQSETPRMIQARNNLIACSEGRSPWKIHEL